MNPVRISFIAHELVLFLGKKKYKKLQRELEQKLALLRIYAVKEMRIDGH